MKTMETTITFQDAEKDLTTLGAVCRELEERGIPTEDAAAYILADMANQSMLRGINPKEAVELCHKIMESKRESSSVRQAQQKPYNMVSTQKSTEEIREMITLMNNFLMCNEIIFCDLEQKYAYRILDMLKEKNLYRHQLKKYANKLREITGMLQMRVRDNDRAATLKSCKLIMPSGRYAEEFHEEAGGIAFKLQAAFLRTFDVKLKLIRMDNKEVALKGELKHPDLMSEMLTLLALSETAIELYAFCQKQIRIAGRGRLIDHSIKSTHHESVRNAVKNLVDQFASRDTVLPQQEALRTRQHVTEFQQELVKDEMFEMFNSQYMALRMDYIEYYLGCVRMEIENGTVSCGLVREVWHRLGTKQAAKSFFKQLAKIPVTMDEDTNAVDVASEISSWDGKAKTVDTFRRLCVECKYAEQPKETEEELQFRILRTVARKSNGQLPSDVLASLVKVHGTKKAVMEQLHKAGFELKPTLDRVKKMKASELKQMA